VLAESQLTGVSTVSAALLPDVWKVSDFPHRCSCPGAMPGW